MKLQNDDDYGRVSLRMPTVILLASAAIFVVLAVVLAVNSSGKKKNTNNYVAQAPVEEETTEVEATDNLTADDLNFWDMYQGTEQTTILDQTMSNNTKRKDELEQREADMRDAENGDTVPEEDEENQDPAADGKHTLVTHKDGTTEWIAINSSLGLNSFEDTGFQSKNGIIGYYTGGKLTSKTGADISQYTTSVDWARLKTEVDYVMIRAGARGYDSGNIIPDSKFSEYVTAAVKEGIPFGVYFSSQATTEGEALEEATYIMTQLAYIQSAIENNTSTGSTSQTNGTTTQSGTAANGNSSANGLIDPSRYGTTTTTKDANGNTTTLVIDEKGNTTETVVDANGNQISKKTVNTDPYGNETTVITDAEGNQSVTTINKNTNTVVTDASQAAGANNTTTTTDPGTGASTTNLTAQNSNAGRTQILNGKFHVTYPIVMEMHMIPNATSRLEKLTNAARNQVITAFCGAIGKGGYNALFCANKEFLLCHVNLNALGNTPIWMVNEGELPDYPYQMNMWKYNTGNTLLKSLTGEYGVDVSFIDYSLR